MYDYFYKIGLKAEVIEGNPTSELDKKLRETAKFEDFKNSPVKQKIKNNN